MEPNQPQAEPPTTQQQPNNSMSSWLADHLESQQEEQDEFDASDELVVPTKK
ncbi:MAG: hypothetical protein WCL04_03985 [Verrucomicrobiota bacterium]